MRDVAASSPSQLDSAVIEDITGRLSNAIAERVVEIIRREGIIPQERSTTTWVNAKEVAHRLGVERNWVYEHADELGARRIGNGPRPRLRFPAQAFEVTGRGARFALVEPSNHSREAAC